MKLVSHKLCLEKLIKMSAPLLMVILGISFVQAQIQINCNDKANGFKYPGKDCKSFYICFSGAAIETECSYGLHYDPKNTKCLPPADISSGKCSLDEFCKQVLHQGERIPHSNCHSYYSCEQKKPVFVPCPDDMNYNYENGICDLPHNLNRNSVCYVPPDLCKNQSDSKTFPHKDITKYYLCIQQNAAVLNCAKGDVYDKEKGHCLPEGADSDYLFKCS